jgi:hypothetical protein
VVIVLDLKFKTGAPSLPIEGLAQFTSLKQGAQDEGQLPVRSQGIIKYSD